MDEQPECSHTIHVEQTKKDQLERQKDLLTERELIPPREEEPNPAVETPTVLTKEHPVSSEVETTPKTLAITAALAIEQAINLIEQPTFSKAQPGFSGDPPVFAKAQTIFSEDQPSHSKDQQDHSTDKPTFSKTQAVDKPALTSLTKIYIDTPKDESASSRELIVASKTQTDTKKGVSLSNEEKALILKKYASTASSTCNINKEYFSTNAPLKINSPAPSPKKNGPQYQLPVQAAVVPKQNNQPPSLFLQALSKLNESSLALAVLPFRIQQSSPNMSKVCNMDSGDLSPPDSLTSAPPTYSFVLRQMTIRRRPRFMGTFFPSPSFVQHAPPPTYTGAFDVYIEPTLPPPPVRVYNFGFSSMPVVCTECGFTGMTLIQSHVTICTHLCAIVLCLLCCWVCVPLPYILSSCKDVYHYCRNCRSFLGMYCPTNPETGYPSVA